MSFSTQAFPPNSLKRHKSLQAQWLKTHEQTFTSILVMRTYVSVSTHFSVYIYTYIYIYIHSKTEVVFFTFLLIHMFTTVAPSTCSGHTIQKLSHCPIPKEEEVDQDQTSQRQLSLLHRRVHSGVMFAIDTGHCLGSSELPYNRLRQDP